MKRKVPEKVAKAVELFQMLLRSSNDPADITPSPKFPVTTSGDTTELSTESKKSEARIENLKSVKK